MWFFIFLTVVALGLTAMGIVSIVFRHLPNISSPATDSDETRMIEQLYKTFDRLEKRVEVLETLLVDHTSESGGANSKNTGRM